MAEIIGSHQLTLDPKTLILSHHFDPLNPSNTLQLITDPYFMERGPRYNAYAQLRESKLRSKRLKLEEDEQVLEISKSEFSPARKAVRFQKIEEDEQFLEIPKSEFSPAKKSVRFQGNLLRNSKKIEENEQFLELPRSEFSPAKKTIRFQGNLQGNSKKQGYSALAQSVPDFSSALRKENRKPPSENRIPRFEKSATPPPSLSKREKMYGSATKLGGVGSKSVNSGEKQSSGKLMMMARKSYASIDELKGLSIAAANAINGENRGAKKGGSVLRKSTVFSSRYY
ncbi:hypothetical protein SOVF_070320 [Spinacia oleracea]|uniref:Uncharacterized protein n=1 Tax=Spinacia oleracea TaxID=3562 RepID=A0A9R0JA58_SPIOL|nr:uncharacterized protein LOC110801647 [Spinacia oleracea]KNA18473.1 hypothetical protein SOVF_070320 [Spinacia oleracea]